MYPGIVNKSCDHDHTIGIGPTGQGAKTNVVFVTQTECQTGPWLKSPEVLTFSGFWREDGGPKQAPARQLFPELPEGKTVSCYRY